MNKQCVLILGQIEYGHVKQLTIMGICLKIRKPHILSTSGWLYIYIHSNFPTAPPLSCCNASRSLLQSLRAWTTKAWRTKNNGFLSWDVSSDCNGFNRFCWCDFFGTSWNFMGYHGIYIYILSILFGMLGGILGLFMEKHVLEASPTGDWMWSNGCLPSGNLLHGYGIDSV